MNSLHNNLAKKIIENAQKNVEIPKNHNYGNLFTDIKSCICINSLAAANYFSQKLRPLQTFELQLPFIQDFVDVLNIIFIDNRRGIMKKPSFLKDSTSVHETEILAIKKLHLIDKKLPADRNGVLLYFIRKILKETLHRIRNDRVRARESVYSSTDIYCLAQICY